MPVRSALVRLIVGALAAHVWLCLPLWYSAGGRSFPLLPPIGEAQPPEGNFIEVGLLVLGLALLLACALWPHRKTPLLALGIVLLALIGQDLNRLQPWTYFYLLVGAVLLLEKETPESALRLLIAAVYVWGGLNKLNPYFAEENFPWFCEAFPWMKPLASVTALGYGVAGGEALLGIGLLWPPARPYFRFLTIGFHLWIIAALSPLGLNWNAVVIPWNAAMGALVWLLFSVKGAGSEAVFCKKRNLSVQGLLLLVWLGPALNGAGIWPEALSWKMYSHTQPEAGLFLTSSASLCPALRSPWEQYAWGEKEQRLLLDDWAVGDLRVPMYNSRHTHGQMARYFCRCIGDSDQAGLWRLEVHPWHRDDERWYRFSCSMLR